MTDGNKTPPLWHGGNLHDAKALFPEAVEPWLDLSTGINPRAHPVPLPSYDDLTRLPSAEDVRRLEVTAAAAYGVCDPRLVVAAPGTQALIQIMPRLREPSRVAILGPTYAEHASSWVRAGHAVATCQNLQDALSGGADVVVAVNPNNPDGRVIAPVRLAEAAAELSGRGGWLVVDEAFADFEAGVSIAPMLPLPGAVVLRSFGKTYGLPGIRLGFALADPALAGALRAELGPWAITGHAISAGSAALGDRAWLAHEAHELATCARQVDAALEQAGFEVIGGTRLFRLAHHPAAGSWFRHLGRQGIWVRRFDWSETVLRFGNPGSKELKRLRNALGFR